MITEALKREQKLTDEQRKRSPSWRATSASAGGLAGLLPDVGRGRGPARAAGGKLVEIAERYKQLVRQVAAAPGDDPEVAKLKGEAKRRLTPASWNGPTTCWRRCRRPRTRRSSGGNWRRRQRAAQRGEIALTRLRYREAAQHSAAAAQRVPPDTRSSPWPPSTRGLAPTARGWGRRQPGADQGHRPPTGRSEGRTRERVPLDWARTQNNLGTALSTLGERESGTARLEEAVAAYRAALEERTRERVPLDWATTQNNLGNALWSARRAGERHGAARGGGRGLPRGARGMDPRAGAARLGDDAEQPRQRASGRWASGRAARRGWRRRSRPTARRWRNGPASGCRSTGR